MTGTKTGQGSFVSASGAFNCGLTCTTQTQNLPQGTTVQITATPASGWVIGDWGGACNTTPSSSNICTFQVGSASTSFSVTFVQLFRLSIDVNGQGTVTVSPGNITCPPTCSANVVGGTTLTLTASPASGSHLVSFGGACTGTGPTCSFTMSQAASVTATFARNTVQASVEDVEIVKRGFGPANRRVVVDIDADERLALVRVQVVRNGRVIAGTRRANLRPGTRTVTLRLRNGIRAGRATIRVIMTNDFGTQKRQSFSRRLPAA